MSMDSCEKHGWWEVNGQDACPSCEITLLRAEVERLNATKELCDNTEAYNIAIEEIRELKRERDAALAQVAVLAEELTYWHSRMHNVPEGCEHPRGCGFKSVLEHLPSEARALLDRLNRLEQYKQAQEQLYADIAEPTIVKKESTVLENRLQRAVAVIEKVKDYIHAWEEEKA